MITVDPMSDAMADGTVPRRRARLGAYTLWQARDYVMNRGVPTIIVALILGYLGVSSMNLRMRSWNGPSPDMIAKYGTLEAARLAVRHELSMTFLSGFLGTFVFLGALFAVNGIVSNDRKLGFYRFLFAKPVTPRAYYGTEFLVNSLGFLLLTTVLALVYGRVVEPVLHLPLLVAVGSGFLCYAGLGFALSALSRWDWLSLVAVAGAADLLWTFYAASTNPLIVMLRPLFPPLNRTSSIYAAAAGGLALPWLSVFWLVGYGTIAFIAGLIILRQRRLAFN
jgi:hypothetical protein